MTKCLLHFGQFKDDVICYILANLKTMCLLRFGQLKDDVSVTFFGQFKNDVSVKFWPI